MGPLVKGCHVLVPGRFWFWFALSDLLTLYNHGNRCCAMMQRLTPLPSATVKLLRINDGVQWRQTGLQFRDLERQCEGVHRCKEAGKRTGSWKWCSPCSSYTASFAGGEDNPVPPELRGCSQRKMRCDFAAQGHALKVTPMFAGMLERAVDKERQERTQSVHEMQVGLN